MKTSHDPQKMVSAAKRRLKSKIEREKKARQKARNLARFDSILGKLIWVIIGLAGLVYAISKF